MAAPLLQAVAHNLQQHIHHQIARLEFPLLRLLLVLWLLLRLRLVLVLMTLRRALALALALSKRRRVPVRRDVVARGVVKVNHQNTGILGVHVVFQVTFIAHFINGWLQLGYTIFRVQTLTHNHLKVGLVSADALTDTLLQNPLGLLDIQTVQVNLVFLGVSIVLQKHILRGLSVVVFSLIQNFLQLLAKLVGLLLIALLKCLLRLLGKFVFFVVQLRRLLSVIFVSIVGGMVVVFLALPCLTGV